MVSFAVLTPSRGTVQSRTIEAVMGNVDEALAAGHVFRGWRLTHDLPIPDCDERAAEAGLATGADVLWWVEEDVIPPAGALLASIALLPDIAPVNYPVGKEGWACTARNPAGTIYWCGLGCTLIPRGIFEALERPWFSTDTEYIVHHRGDGRHEFEPRPAVRKPADRYGTQDIYFFRRAIEAGFRIVPVPDKLAAHAHLVALGRRDSNHGTHDIEIDSRVPREQFW